MKLYSAHNFRLDGLSNEKTVVLQLILAAATSHIVGGDNSLANSILNGTSSANLMCSATEAAILISLLFYGLQKWLW